MSSPQAPDGRLVVCPTPIGNMQDITLRALEQLAAADTIACEDTRHTAGLLARHGIEGRLVSLHEHNEARRARELAEAIRGGATVALVSDAGTPLVSDPGYELVRRCVEEGLHVEVLPGPSAAVTALVASGLPCERWLFAGFLPRARGELREVLAARDTLVAYESPRRLVATLRAVAADAPERPAAVCRELTKVHEEVRRGTAAELLGHYESHLPRGEIVLVLGAAQAGQMERERAVDTVRELIASGARPRAAAAAVAGLSGHSANELYRRALAAADTAG